LNTPWLGNNSGTFFFRSFAYSSKDA